MRQKLKINKALLSIFVSMLYMTTHAIDVSNVTQGQATQLIHLKNSIKLDQETDIKYHHFTSLDQKEQSSILHALYTQGTLQLSTSLDTQVISKWGFLKNIIDFDSLFTKSEKSKQKEAISILEKNGVKSENTTLVQNSDKRDQAQQNNSLQQPIIAKSNDQIVQKQPNNSHQQNMDISKIPLNLSAAKLQKLEKSSFKSLQSVQGISQTPSTKDIFEIIALKNNLNYSKNTSEENKRFFWNPQVSIYNGDNRRFLNDEKFSIIEFISNNNEQKSSFKVAKSFQTSLLKDAFDQFRKFVTGDTWQYPSKQYGLIGNHRLLVTTSAFDEFYSKSSEIQDQQGKEFKKDFITKMMIGFGFQKNLLKWPQGSVDKDYNGYQILKINQNKQGQWIKVGHNWKEALDQYNKISKTEKNIILTHSNGKIFKLSGIKNSEGMYWDTYINLAGYLQKNFKDFNSILRNEQEAGFVMQWQIEDKRAAQLKLLREWYKGNGEELYKPYTLYVVIYNRETQQFQTKNLLQYTYFQKGIEDLISLIDKTILSIDQKSAYLFSVKETNPIYCSDGPIQFSKICQQMIGYALYTGKQTPLSKLTDPKIPSNSQKAIYFAILKDKKGKIIRIDLSQDYKASVKKYDQLIKSKKYVTGVVSNTQKYLFKNQFSKFQGVSAIPVDVYSLITQYSQQNLKIYISESHNEQQANLITKKDFESGQKQQHEALLSIYNGKGLKLFKSHQFEIVTYDKRSNKIELLQTLSSNNMSQVFQTFAETVYQKIIKKQAEKAYLYISKESGPLYCSEGSLQNEICKSIIGYSIVNQWLTPESRLTDLTLTPDNPNYSYIAYMTNSHNPNVIKRFVLGKNKDKKLLADYKAKIKAGKFDVAVLSHSAIPSQYQEMVSSKKNLFKFQDVFQMIATYAQSLGSYKQSLTDEISANLKTDLQVQAQNILKIEKIQSIYTGNQGQLYKKVKIFAVSYDNNTSQINKIYQKNFSNLKEGILEAGKQIEKLIISKNKNLGYMILSETFPLYCSVKNDMTNKYCQRMIGNAIFNKYINLDNKYNLKNKIVDKLLNKEEKKYEYVAYVWNPYKKQLKVQKVSLGKDKKKAIEKFNKLFGKKSDFTIGVIGHSQQQKFIYTKSSQTGTKKNRDLYQMITVYCQQQGLFLKAAANEKEAFLKTQDEWELILKQQNETLSKLYRGNDEMLNKKYTFNVVTYHRRSNKIQLLFQQQFLDMKTAITQMTNQVLKKVIANEEDQAYLFGVKESNQFYCSEGDLKKPLCQRMIGRSIRNDFVIPSKKLVNKYIVPSSIDYKYVAYLKDSKGKISKKALDADWQKSRKLYTSLISPKSQYKIGVIGHTSLNVWLAPHSQRIGTLKDSDVDELIAQYCQENLKIYAKGDITEKGAQVLTKSEAYEIQKQNFKRLEILTQGKHSSLYKTYQFVVFTYDLNTNEIKKLTQSGHKNFKVGLSQIISKIQNALIIPLKESAFTIQIKETAPFYCSEGELNNPICQRIIGYSILKGYQRAPRQLVDQQISTLDPNYQYVCYVQDTRKVGSLPIKYNLSSDFKQAQKWYNEIFNKSEEVFYTVGVMGHTQRQEFLNQKTALTGTLAFQDVNQMLTTYIQNSHKLFLKSGTSSQITKLKTKSQWIDQLKKANLQLSSIFKGTGVKLYKTYQFFAVVYNKKTHKISNVYQARHKNLKQALKKINQAVYDYIIRAERSHAYLYGVKDTVPFYCSEGDLKSAICQRMIGHSIKNKWFYLNKKFVDTNIPKDSKHWTYIAYLRKNSASKDVVKIKLDKDFQASLKKYKGLTEGVKAQYKIGLISHSAQRVWLHPVSSKKGLLFEIDVYEMLVTYCQQKKKQYLKSGVDEKTANLKSRKEMDVQMKDKLKLLYKFYQGQNEKLYKNVTMGVMTYNKYTHKIQQLKWQKYDNMKQGFDDAIESIYKFVLKPHKNMAFTVYIHESNPLYCSEGKDLQNKFCQRMIGHALRKGWLKPDVKMVDSNISEQDEAYQYVAYLQNTGKKQKNNKKAQLGEVARISLGSDFQVAQDKFMELLEDGKYSIGIIGHTQINNFWNIQTQHDGLLKDKDVDRMLALYSQQKLKLYINSANDEKKANIKLQKDWKIYLEQEKNKLKKLFAGTDDVLSIKYFFFALAYHRRSHQFSVIYWGKHNSMKNAMNKLTDSVFKNIIDLEEDKAFLFSTRETAPFYCSEGSLDKKICQRMIGHAIKTNLIYPSKKIIDRGLDTSDQGYNYVAYLRNTQNKQVSRVNLDSDLKKSIQQYQKFFLLDEESEYSIGIIGHTALNVWLEPHVQKTGVVGVNDLYELIAEYAQKSLKLYTKTSLNEKDLSLLTKKQLDKNILKENKKIRQIYKGKGEKLYKSYIIFATIYDKKTRVINYLNWEGYYSLKNAMTSISKQIIENVINQKRDVAFILQSRDTVPFYCSEGVLSKPLCRRMIGYSIWKGWQIAPQKLIDRSIPSIDENYQYAAYVQNSLGKDKKVKKILLGQDYSKAQNKFKSLFNKKQYNVGAIGHTALPVWSQPISIKIGKRLNHDVYEMIAQYIQENLKNYTKSGIDEQTALLKFDSSWNSYLKVQQQKLNSLFRGTGEKLYKGYNFIGATFNKKTNGIEIIYDAKHKSMKKAVKQLNDEVYHKVVLAEQDQAYLYATKESGPFYCSEGDLSQQVCQRLIGYIVYNQKIIINRKLSDKYIHETEDKFIHIAYLKNKKTKKVERIPLVKDKAKSIAQFKQLTSTKGKYNVGIVGHSSLGKWQSPLSQLKGSQKLLDVYEVLAKYIQDSLNLYKNTGLDENRAELITEKFIKEKRRRAKQFLTSLFVGSGAQLKEPVTLSAITYNRNTKQFSVVNQKSYLSMKVGMAELTYVIYKKVIVPNDDVSYLIVSKQSIPLYCSQGQMRDKICQRMIGYALYKNQLKANVRIVDTHIPSDSEASKYIGYIFNAKAKNAQVKRHELSAGLKSSIDQFNNLVKKGNSIGIICHSAKQEWQAATSKRLGPYKMLDIYELLASYSQNHLRVYLQNGERGINEQFAQLTFRKDWEEHLKTQKQRLLSLYRGNGQEELFRPYTFFLTIYHSRSHYIKKIYQGQHINMKEALLIMAEKALSAVIYPDNDFKFLFFVKETVPLWCQSGNLRDQKFCQRMIGHALKKKWLNPNQKLVDPTIQQDDQRYSYVAYVQNKANNRVEKIVLDKDLKKSQQIYEKLFSGDLKKQKYSAGIIGHSAINQYWNQKSIKKNLKKTDIITSELLAKHCQFNLNLYVQNALNENDAQLQLKRSMQNNYKQVQARLNSLYRGSGQLLQKPFTFSAVQYDKDSDQISLINAEQFDNMKLAIEVLVNLVYTKIVKENKNYAYLYLVKEKNPLYCSEGSLNNIYCQRIIGKALQEGWLQADKKFVNVHINKVDSDYQYVAYVHNKNQKNSKIVKQLLGKDLAKAKTQFASLFTQKKSPFTIGILGSTYNQKWQVTVSKFTGKLQNQDVYQLVAQYNQRNLGIWNNNNAIQNEQQANLGFKKDFDNKIKLELKSKKSLYKGVSETLVTPLTFSIVTFDKYTNKFSIPYSKKHNSMKVAMDEMGEFVINNIYKNQKKKAFIYLVKEKSPIYCSEGKLTSNVCMRIIGQSVQKNWVVPPKQLVNKELNQPKQQFYVAYLKQKGSDKVVRKTLSSNKDQAVKIYKSLFVKKSKKQQPYEIGIIGHTMQNVWINPVSKQKGSKKNNDVNELVAGYIQQTLKSYTNNKLTETSLGALTKKQLLTKQQQISKKIEQTFKGKGDHLYKKYSFYAVYYDKETHKMYLPKSHQFSNMKVAMDALALQVVEQIIKPQKERAYTFFVKETVPIYCSEGPLSSKICKRMIGYALMNHLQALPKQFINKHISKKDPQYQYVAYVKNIKSKKVSVEKITLGSDFNTAIKNYNAKIKVINKKQRYIGVISHTQLSGFWHPVTTQKNNLKFYDVYELLSEYLQNNLNIFKDNALNEQSANLKTKRDVEKRLKSQRKLLSKLYNGKGEKLAKHYMFLALGYQKQTNVISKVYQSQHQSMKNAMKRIGEAVYRQILKPDRNVAYLFAVREGSPFYCSEGDLTKKICQRMIGYALKYNLIYPPTKLVNKKLPRDSQDYKFIGYMFDSDTNKVIRVPYYKDKEQSISQFNEQIQGGKYGAGILSHSAYNFWYAKSSDNQGSLKDKDLYEIIVKYIQNNLNLFKKSGVNENEAGIQTVTQKDKLIKKNQQTLLKPFKKLTGKEQFFQPYNLRIVIYYYDVQPIQNILIGEYTNLKSGIRDTVDFIQTVVTKENLNSKFEVLYYLEEGSPFYCSAGKIDNKICQIMLGEAIVDQKFQTNGVLGKSGLIDAYACSENFYAIIQESKGKISKQQIKQTSWDKAVKEFQILTKSNSSIGILYQNSFFGDFKGKHVYIKTKFQKGNKQNEDVYILVAKYYVNSEIYTQFSVENAGILAEQRNAQLQQIKQDYLQRVQKIEMFAQDLLQKTKGNSSKFVKPFQFTVFSWRNSSNSQNIIKWKPFKAENIQDFLKISSQRIQELNQISKKVHLEPYNIPRTLQGQREFIKQKNFGEFQHIVLLSSGRKPKLMLTSHGVNSTGSQYMIGFAYSQLNSKKLKWWRSGLQNAIKNQLYKISDQYRTVSNSSQGIQRAFYVVQNKETGLEKIKVCNISNTESRKDTRQQMNVCAQEFLRNIEDPEKEQGFLMEQYLPVMGSPATLLSQQNQTIKQTFSGYTSFGKWIIKNLPEDFRENSYSESDIDLPLQGFVESQKRKYFASSFTRQTGGKSVFPRFKYHLSNSLGLFEKFLIDQSLITNSVHPNFWKDYKNKDNFKKPSKTSGIIITKGKDGQYYPVATNKKDVILKDHDTLTSIGLFMKQFSKKQQKNLFKNCQKQEQYLGNWTYLFWDPVKQKTERQVCSKCQKEFDSFVETLKKNNSGLSEYQIQQLAMKNFGQEKFSKIYYENMNQAFPDGMSLFSKDGSYIYSAYGRGYDQQGVTKEYEVFFTLGKYAQENCKNWQKVYKLEEIGIKPV